jgi:hypothetical protein
MDCIIKIIKKKYFVQVFRLLSDIGTFLSHENVHLDIHSVHAGIEDLTLELNLLEGETAGTRNGGYTGVVERTLGTTSVKVGDIVAMDNKIW